MTLDPTLRDQLARVIHDAACRCGGRIHHRHYITAADKAAELLTTQPAPLSQACHYGVGEMSVSKIVLSRFSELRLLAEAANTDAVQTATYERDWPLSSRAVGRFLRALNPDLALELLDAAEERDEIADRLAQLLCDLTGGRLSKTTYPVPVMAQEIEQYLSACHESDLKDERDALAAKLAEVRKVAEYYAGLTNVDAGSAILRALDATPETGGES